MKPAVSVIFPVYGVEDYIENCLRSVVGQTFRDMELILVDDESRDGSISVAEKFLEKTDLKWRVIRQKNSGQGAARDYGIREARGKYVVCIDADDMVSPIFLESMYKEAESGEYDAVFTGFLSAKNGNPFYTGPVTFQPISREDLLYQFLCRTLIPILPAMLIRREVILKYDLRVRAGCRFSEDVYFMWLLFSRVRTVAYTQAKLYHYLLRTNSTMTASSAARIITGYEAFCALPQELNFIGDFQGVSYLLPRWVLGSLRTTAGISSYPEFYELAQKMNYRTHVQALRGFPERKARILAACLRVSPRVFYNVVRRLG